MMFSLNNIEEDDPSDWPIQFDALKKIDSLLRCSICYAFFDTAVLVPSCSHNYCSYCIRKHLTYKQCCPSCNLPMIDSDLKCNRVLDEVVVQFKQIRSQLLAIVQKYLEIGISAISSEDIHQDNSQDFEPEPKFRTPKSNRHISKQSNTVLHHTADGLYQGSMLRRKGNNITQEASEKATISTESSTVQTVAPCPVCQEIIPVNNINMHLDGCLKRQDTESHLILHYGLKRKVSLESTHGNSKKRKKDISSHNETLTTAVNTRTSQPHKETANDVVDTSTSQPHKETANDLIASTSRCMKPIPKACFNVLNEKKLRLKTKDFGLSSKGDKNTLLKRLENYVLLYNSQCDSATPLSPTSVAKQVEQNEQYQIKFGYKPNVVMHTHDHRHTLTEKEAFLMKHSKQYDKDYTKLIDQVKERKTKSALNKTVREELVEKEELVKKEELEFNDREHDEYVFNIVEIDSDSCSSNLNKQFANMFPAALIRETPVVKVEETKGNASKSRKNKINSLSRDNSISKNSKKKNQVQSRNIGSFFQPKSMDTSKQKILYPVQNTLPSIKEIKKENIKDKQNSNETISIHKLPTKRDSSFFSLQITPRQNKQINSTVIAGKMSELSSSITGQLSPVLKSDKRSAARKNIFRTSSHLKGSFNLETKQINSNPKTVAVLAYDTDNSSDSSNCNNFPSTLSINDTITENDDLTGLTAEISYLVDQAISNPSKYPADDSETNSCEDTQGVVPRPPSDLNFTELITP